MKDQRRASVSAPLVAPEAPHDSELDPHADAFPPRIRVRETHDFRPDLRFMSGVGAHDRDRRQPLAGEPLARADADVTPDAEAMNDAGRRLRRGETHDGGNQDRRVKGNHQRAVGTERRERPANDSVIRRIDPAGRTDAEEVGLEAGALRRQGVSADVRRMTSAQLGLRISARDEENGASQREGAGPEWTKAWRVAEDFSAVCGRAEAISFTTRWISCGARAGPDGRYIPLRQSISATGKACRRASFSENRLEMNRDEEGSGLDASTRECRSQLVAREPEALFDEQVRTSSRRCGCSCSSLGSVNPSIFRKCSW